MAKRMSREWRLLHTRVRSQLNLRNKRVVRSQPGEFPRLDRGELRRSIYYTYNATTHTLRVGSTLVRAKYLEYGTKKMKPRPFLRRTCIEERPRIEAILVGP